MKTKSDVYSNVDYFHIVKNGRTQLIVEVNNKTKAEVQELIGNELGEGNFTYSMKLKGESRSKTGKIRAFTTREEKKGIDNTMDDKRIIALENKITALHETISSKTHPDFNMLLSLKDSAYAMQIEHYKNIIDSLKETISDLKDDIKEMQKEGNNNGFDFGQLLQLGSMFVKSKLPGVKVLKDDSGNITEDVGPGQHDPRLNRLINSIDTSALTDEQIEQYTAMGLNYLKQFGLLKEN